MSNNAHSSSEDLPLSERAAIFDRHLAGLEMTGKIDGQRVVFYSFQHITDEYGNVFLRIVFAETHDGPVTAIDMLPGFANRFIGALAQFVSSNFHDPNLSD